MITEVPSLNSVDWRLRHTCPRTYHALTQKGGWRGLLDPLSDEWYKSSVPDKVQVIHSLVRLGLQLNFIMRVFVDDQQDRVKAREACNIALMEFHKCELLGPAQYAKKYLLIH